VIVSKVGEEFDDGLSRRLQRRAHPPLGRTQPATSGNRLYRLVLVHSDGNDLAILNDCEVATLAELKRRARFAVSAFPAKPSTAA
jgi:hypothetical protein